MASLEYSLEALNILNVFHQVDKVVYVEGQDDVPFWEFLFNKFTNLNIHIEEVGGKENLQLYIDKIKQESVGFIVAKDLDYSNFFDEDKKYENILTTAGYSIENTLINKSTLFYIVKKLCLLPDSKINKDDFEEWLSKTNILVGNLILLGVYNEIHRKGVCVIPSNADRFMVSKSSFLLCSEKINDYLNNINLAISDKELKDLSTRLKILCEDHLDILNGHFYFSAAHRFVTLKSAKLKSSTNKDKIQCSSETFLALLMSAFECCFNNNHSHYDSYSKQFALVS